MKKIVPVTSLKRNTFFNEHSAEGMNSATLLLIGVIRARLKTWPELRRAFTEKDISRAAHELRQVEHRARRAMRRQLARTGGARE